MIDVDGSVAFVRGLWNDDVKPEKNPADFTRHQILIDQIQPGIVVETGLHWGYGLRWWAERVPQVITVERDAQMIYDYKRDAHGLGPLPKNVTVFEGDAIMRFDDIAAYVRVRRAMSHQPCPIYVVLDSDHGRDHVLREMERYGNLVTPGSYMVVEDTIYHWIAPGPRHEGNFYDGDAFQAVEDFMKTHDGWTIDTVIEDMLDVTLNPSGWLRRD
jgi:cephalosporin hydroxylase